MKKIFAFVLSIALVFSISTTAFAAEIKQDTDPKTANTEITTSIAPTYTVTIPANTEITFNATSTDLGAVSLDAAQINPGYAVKVEANAGELKNKADATKTIPYKLMAGDSEFTSAEYTIAGQATALSIAITQAAWNAAFAGEYEGVITFTVSYIAK